ncbi:hypothetical protein ACKKBF_B21720 [Auxenochlorella protothecoides x Auxenochlorella symbiontica]
MVNATLTPAPDSRTQFIDALRDALAAPPEPVSDARRAAAALEKLQFDYPDATDSELECFLNAVLGPHPPPITHRLLEVVGEEAGRMELLDKEGPASQQHMYRRVHSACLLVALQHCLHGRPLPLRSGDQGGPPDADPELLLDLADRLAAAASQMGPGDWERVELAQGLQQTLVLCTSPARGVAADLLRRLEAAVVRLLRQACQARPCQASACVAASLPTLLQVPGPSDEEWARERSELAVQLASSAAAACGAGGGAGAALWHVLQTHLGPALERSLRGGDGAARGAAVSCLAWLAARTPRGTRAPQLLADCLVASGAMAALVPRCMRDHCDAEGWRALLLLCAASPPLRAWAEAVPGLVASLQGLPLAPHAALLQYAMGGGCEPLIALLDGACLGTGAAQAEPLLRLVADVRGALGGDELAAWPARLGASLAALQVRLTGGRRAGATEGGLRARGERLGAEQRGARLVAQRDAAAHAACHALLKYLLLPADSEAAKKD